MKLSKNFSLIEWTRSQTASRLGIPNQPGPAALARIHYMVNVYMQPFRDYVGAPIIPTSGYRSPELNAQIGGSATSAHMAGNALDFIVVGMTPVEAFHEMEKFLSVRKLDWDQLIEEYGDWTHLGIVGRNRKEILIYTKEETKDEL